MYKERTLLRKNEAQASNLGVVSSELSKRKKTHVIFSLLLLTLDRRKKFHLFNFLNDKIHILTNNFCSTVAAQQI